MPDRLLLADNHQRIRHCAVVVRLVPGGTHAGIIYRCPSDGQLWLLHYGAPGVVRRESWSDKYGWCRLRLNDSITYQLTQLCKLVFDLQEYLPYGVEFASTTRFLAADGALDKPMQQLGLTCATFVLALLNGYNIKLLDFESWPVRPTDQLRMQELGQAFNDPGISQEYPCTRFRPEEVAAACLTGRENVHFEEAEPLSKEILSDLDNFLERKRSGY